MNCGSRRLIADDSNREFDRLRDASHYGLVCATCEWSTGAARCGVLEYVAGEPQRAAGLCEDRGSGWPSNRGTANRIALDKCLGQLLDAPTPYREVLQTQPLHKCRII